MTIQRLNEVIGENSIFTTLTTGRTMPWASDTSINNTLLDFEYMNNFSGRKVISPAVENSLGTDGKITTANMSTLCSVAYMMFNKKWARNWAVLTAEYNPIENYNMTETEETTRDNKETHSGNDTLVQTGTDTFKHTGTDTNVRTGSESAAHTGTIKDDGDTTSENEVSAFNSGSYQDSNKNTGTADNTRTHNDTISTTYNNLTDTDTKNLTDTETRNMTDTNTHGHVIDNDDDETRELTRSGNIGVTTSQQMLQSDIDLWKWNFFYEVFHDIDKVFTISTY